MYFLMKQSQFRDYYSAKKVLSVQSEKIIRRNIFTDSKAKQAKKIKTKQTKIKIMIKNKSNC